MSELGIVDWAVCLAYLVVICGLAIWSMRGQHDNEDYFVGGRRMNWFAVGISLFATSFSSISFLGLPQRGAFQDFSFYLTILLIPLLITPILWFFFVPLYVRLQVSSGYAYLRLRFSPSVQRIGSLLYCGYALGWMGAMLYAIALTLKSVMDLNHTQYVLTTVGLGIFATVYTAAGGLRAVIWTDVLQAVTLAIAVIIVLLLAVFLLGMFFPRANSAGVLIGLMVGAIALGCVMAFTDIPKWWYGVFTILPTLLVGAKRCYLDWLRDLPHESKTRMNLRV